MPQVPYNPVPDVRPSEQGAPAIRVNAPGAAFGTTIAQAVEGVGGQLDKVGNEIFSRATALQELNNRTSADEANTNYAVALGQRHANFAALQGQDAVKDFPVYMQDVQNLREQYGQNLNPMAKRYYDSESRGQMARTVFNGAGHAATQNKIWQMKTAQATLATNQDGAFSTPDDEAGFQAKWNAVPGQVATLAGVGGWDNVQTQHEVFKERSLLLAQRIAGTARTAPIKARQMLDEARKNNQLEYNDWNRAEQLVEHQVVTSGSRTISDAVNAGFPAYWGPQVVQRIAGVQEPMQRLIKQIATDHPELRFTVPPLGGARTPEQQQALVNQGRSQTLLSTHLDGRGLDLAPLGDNGQVNFNDKEGYAKIEAAMKEASVKLGIPLTPEHDKIKGWDPGHYSIPSNLDFSKIPSIGEEPLQSRVDRAVSEVHRLAPDDANFEDAVRQRVIANYNQTRAIKRDFDFRNSTTVGNAVIGGYGDKLPTTIEELRALDPKVAEAYDNLEPPAKRKVLGYLTQNAKDDYPSNEQNFRTFMQLRGQAESDPKAFLEQDVPGLHLPRAWRKELFSIQQAKSKNMLQDPRVTHALQVLGPMLQSAKVDRTDKDRYEEFVGALHDQLIQFQQNEKRPPKDEDINLIGTRLLQEQHTHWWESSQGLFEVPVPEDEEQKIRSDPKWQELGVQPTNQMIQRVWIAKKYQELFGGSAKPKSNEALPPPVPHD